MLEDYLSKGTLYLFMANRPVELDSYLFGVLHLPSIKFLKLFDPLRLEKCWVLLFGTKTGLEAVSVWYRF